MLEMTGETQNFNVLHQCAEHDVMVADNSAGVFKNGLEYTLLPAGGFCSTHVLNSNL